MRIWQDLRFGLRTLRHAPGFAATAMATMALGIGATTAIFSLADGMLWKPLPIPHLDRLLMVLQRNPAEPRDWNWVRAGDMEDIRRWDTIFDGIAEWQEGFANIVGFGGEPERVAQFLVSVNFFDVVGVRPTVGHGFVPGDDQIGREREVVLGDALWRRRFGADTGIIGKTIRLDDQDFVVTGVMPPGFVFPKAAELWTPLALNPMQRSELPVAAMGRLKPGSTSKQASAELDRMAAQLAREHPVTNRERHFAAVPTHRYLIGEYAHDYVTMLFWAVVFVLLIACSNVANLQFARATGRTRELAVRSALGAGRRRVVSQLLTESVLVALGGAVLGLVVAAWGLDTIRAYMPPEVEKYIPGWRSIRLDGRALGFMLLAAVASGILAGLAPAWQSARTNLHECLKEGGRGSTAGRSRHRLRGVLVGAQVAMAVVLLVGAGLMVRGFQTLLRDGTRLEAETVLTLRLALTAEKYPRGRQQAAFYRDVLDRIAAIPGVRTAAVATAVPYSQHSSDRQFAIEGKPSDPANPPVAMYQQVSPDYFSMLHMPLLAGRFLAENDVRDAPAVAVVGARLAKRWWGTESPVGRRIKLRSADPDNPWVTIVGVAGDVPYSFYERDPRPVLYVPFVQFPRLWMDVGVRTAANPLLVAPAVTAAIRAVDPEQPITNVATMDTLRHFDALGLNYVAVLMAVFGALALVLASVGVYGVMAYLVSQQAHEIGVRMALGASRSTVMRMVFQRGLATATSGLLVGVSLAWWLAHMLATLVFGVNPNDAATFAGIPLALMATAAVAIYIPARRATKIDPIVALRYE